MLCGHLGIFCEVPVHELDCFLLFYVFFLLVCGVVNTLWVFCRYLFQVHPPRSAPLVVRRYQQFLAVGTYEGAQMSEPTQSQACPSFMLQCVTYASIKL